MSDHRYRKDSSSINFDERDSYKSFAIEQVQPYPTQKGGEGPYRVMFNGNEIFRNQFHGDCKYHIEEIVKEYRSFVKDFTNKWKLPKFPSESEI